MAELKTKLNKKKSVRKFLGAVKDQKIKTDCLKVLEIMKSATKAKPVMWGDNIIGFGTYHYKYPSGREGDWFTAGFSPRRQNTTVYIMDGFRNHKDLLGKLGKFTTGKSCLYIKKLENVDIKVLGELIKRSVRNIKRKYK